MGNHQKLNVHNSCVLCFGIGKHGLNVCIRGRLLRDLARRQVPIYELVAQITTRGSLPKRHKGCRDTPKGSGKGARSLFMGR